MIHPRITAALVAAALSAVAVPALAAGDAARGKTLFSRCVTCHKPASGPMGPSLNGVLGRKAGTATGFRYSKALTASGKTWSETELDAFLAAPGKAVPGTSMFINVANPKDRADVIAYLATVK
ncbi:c-type cytochrome [Caulobacter segnis]|uniref:c-type cytochrome n=1 Tax=Caulobacter segnis TaxID=88688 RepID=UPI0024106622|nr:c-type cytochrome [Caulobacter segnis]MDG2523440.1 c-type cytochrome [Caulobacter segnis]